MAEPPHYLYVLWAIQDGLVKVGITNQFARRQSEHNGNSSNPLQFTTWKLYKFFSLFDAQSVEKVAKQRLLESGFRFREKKELFKCTPKDAISTIDAVIQDLGVSSLNDFPLNASDALSKFSDFPSLPDHGLELLTDDQVTLYWRGAQDALAVLSYFEDLPISQSDLLAIRARTQSELLKTSELWSIISDHYRNSSQTRNLPLVAAAHNSLKDSRSRAYADWQGLED